MHFSIDPKIQSFIIQLDDAKLELVLATRDLILSSNKDIKEKIKFGRITFYCKDIDIAFLCIKAVNKHIEVGFFNGHLLEDPNHLLKAKAQKIRRVEIMFLNANLKKQIKTWISMLIESNNSSKN